MGFAPEPDVIPEAQRSQQEKARSCAEMPDVGDSPHAQISPAKGE